MKPQSYEQGKISAQKSSPSQAREKPLSTWRLILSVFLPFAAGYYLSFLFRTINTSISPELASDFGLGAAETGLLASVYFLIFAGAQIPIGVLLDRYGPRRVQSVLLVIAVGGAALFGNADSLAELLTGPCHDWARSCRRVDGWPQGDSRVVSERPNSVRQWLHDHVGLARGRHGYGADGLAGELDWLAEPVRNPDDRDACDRCVNQFCRARIRRQFQTAGSVREATYTALHLFGSAVPENCAALGNLHRIVLGIAFVVGCVLAR